MSQINFEVVNVYFYLFFFSSVQVTPPIFFFPKLMFQVQDRVSTFSYLTFFLSHFFFDP